MYAPSILGRKQFFLLPVLIITAWLPLAGQSRFDSLLNKSYIQRERLLWKISDEVHFQPDSVKAFRFADSLYTFGIQHNDKALALEVTLYKIWYLRNRYPQQKDRILGMLAQIIKQSSAAGIPMVEAKAHDMLAEYYWFDIRNYELALEQYQQLDQLLRPIAAEDFPDKIQHIFHIGSAYFHFKDYKKAIHYFRTIPAMKAKDRFAYSYKHAINSMAYTYQEMGNLDSAAYYWTFLNNFCTPARDSTWIGIIAGNLGYLDYLRGHFEKAIPQMELCIDRAIIDQDWGLAAGSLMPLADIYFIKGKLAPAESTVLQAKSYVERSGQYWRNKNLFPLLAKLYTIKGQHQLAARYTDSIVMVMDSLNRASRELLMARAIQKEAINDQKAKLIEIENSRQLTNLRFNGLLILAIIIVLVVVYLYRNKRRLHRQEQALKELQLKETAKELSMAQHQLQDFTRNIAEKNKLIENLEEQFGANKILEELQQSILLTGTDWGRFRDLFEQVYPGYLQRLNEKIPGISPSEIRLMALTRLNFSNKEMAAALGVSAQAIRVTWHRLRKKAGLQEEMRLEEWASRL
jgi:tetratricopeptide (TPR) repeat protein